MCLRDRYLGINHGDWVVRFNCDKYLYGAGERGYRVALKEIFGEDFVGNLEVLKGLKENDRIVRRFSKRSCKACGNW